MGTPIETFLHYITMKQLVFSNLFLRNKQKTNHLSYLTFSRTNCIMCRDNTFEFETKSNKVSLGTIPGSPDMSMKQTGRMGQRHQVHREPVSATV